MMSGMIIHPEIETERATHAPGPTEAYVRWLREEIDSGRWSADPGQPCLLYKVYSERESLSLDSNIPLRFGMNYSEVLHSSQKLLQANSEQKLAWLLYFTHGLIRIQRAEAGKPPIAVLPKKQSSATQPKHLSGPVARFTPFLGRTVPSGGSLHPLEIYLALGNGWGLPAGIYHYDSAHHSLDQLRTGNFLTEVASCLPEGNQVHPGSAVLFPTIYMQKNHQKYAELSYSLQSLDAGIVIKQCQFVTRCLGLLSNLHLHFADHPLHHLLGLNLCDENIYAVISLNTKQVSPTYEHEHSAGHQSIARGQAMIEASEIAKLPPLTANYTQPFPLRPQSPLLKRLYAASLLNHLAHDDAQVLSAPSVESAETEVKLPEASIFEETFPYKRDIAQVLLRRSTGFQAIDTRTLSIQQLSDLLAPLHQLKNFNIQLCDCQLYCVISRVSNLPADVYRYIPQRHSLFPIHTDHLFHLLMRISTAENIQPQLAPINLFLCGNYKKAQSHFGERGLRILGIEIGRILQCISISAAAHDLATHIHLSFAVEGTRKRLLQIPNEDHIPLASMMIGHQKGSQRGLFETIWY